ncbi:MAG: hypothetical protein P8N94_02220 [Gammaproteobacteria bacterium]|nr:hypothetical protein [Gammaproteobacteria bacterium]
MGKLFMLNLRVLILFSILYMLVACGSSDDDTFALTERFFVSDQSEKESVVIPALLNLALSDDPDATYFLSQVYVYELDAIPIDSRAQIESLFLSNETPYSAGLLARNALNGIVDLQHVYEFSMMALDQCYLEPDYYSPLYFPPVFSPADFFSIAWDDVNQLSQGMEKLRKCADYYPNVKWLESDLLWRVEGKTNGMYERLRDLKAIWRRFMKDTDFIEVTDKNPTLAKALSPDKQSSELYIDNLFSFPSVESLDEVIPKLREDALAGDIRAARSLGIYYSGQSFVISEDFSISPSQYEKASPWFELAAESDPASKYYLWALRFGRADPTETSQIRHLLIESIKEGFYIPACMALSSRPVIAEQISEEDENYSRDEIFGVLSSICREGYFNQLDLLTSEIESDGGKKGFRAATGLSITSIGSYPGLPLINFGQDASYQHVVRGTIAIFVSLFFAYLAFLTFEANPSNRKNRAISLILLLEGYLLLSMFGISALPVSLASLGVARVLLSIAPIAMVGLTIAYLMFVSTTQTFLGKYSLNPAVKYGLPILIAIYQTIFFLSWGYGIFPMFSGDGLMLGTDPLFMRFIAALLLGFHVLILGNLLYVFFIERKEKKGRTETKYFLAAYLARFCFMTFTLVSVIFLTFQDSVSRSAGEALSSTFIAGEAIYGSLFAYGILQGELFGVKRLIKKGLVKLLVIIMLFGTYYLIEDLVSENFSDLLGNLAGLFSAVLVFMFEKPISKKAFQIIDRVFPDDSVDSDAEKAYRYLYGLAIDDGVITPNERLMLEFTAENLSLGQAQIDMIEASQ